MSKNPIPEDQRLQFGSAAQGSASLTTSSPVHSQQQQLALSGDIEAGDKVTPPPAAVAHLSPSAARNRLSIGNLMAVPAVVRPQQQQVVRPPAAMESMEEEGGLEGDDDERGQSSGAVATEEEEMGAKCTSRVTRSSLTPPAQLHGAASSAFQPAATPLQQTGQASSQADTTSPHQFRLVFRTNPAPFILGFNTALRMIIQDVQHGGHSFSFGGLHPSTLETTMRMNAPWSAPPFLALFQHLLPHLKLSNPERRKLKRQYISFAKTLFKIKSASRPSETGAADRTLRDEIVDLWIRAWEEQPAADRGRVEVTREDLESYY
ncbi:hypothetical protein B9479_003153 [Cryptococcus floricola]|uniref:Uncharacterized protein n=1 Tax=Cryptococcus floricola TaxID=2591691 RepID=A0A5D3AXH9_9TREE|nr:hypothetical protein B9479_003153 [Cryptococcus floricola]